MSLENAERRERAGLDKESLLREQAHSDGIFGSLFRYATCRSPTAFVQIDVFETIVGLVLDLLVNRSAIENSSKSSDVVFAWNWKRGGEDFPEEWHDLFNN